MDDLLNKTRELSSIVSSLKDKGEDNVELQGILAQLQAAVAKRTTTKPTEEPVQTDIVAKTEPVEPEPVEPEIGPVEPELTDSINDAGELLFIQLWLDRFHICRCSENLRSGYITHR